VKIYYLTQFLVFDEILIEIFQANGFEDNKLSDYRSNKNNLFWQLGLDPKTYWDTIKAQVTD
ncbi:MAG: hypothetical protein WBL64_10455, partial [Nitrososphaeraceae archaeon]